MDSQSNPNARYAALPEGPCLTANNNPIEVGQRTILTGELPQSNGDLYLDSGVWKLRWREDDSRKPAWIGPSTGPEGLTRQEAERIVRENFRSRTDPDAPPPESAMTIADFVENAFIPEHVALKTISGRTHYLAILKHVLSPEEATRVFHLDTEKLKTRLETVPGWPYIGNVRLCDARPHHVQQLLSAAVARGYSAQTVKHIRNVVSAIFAHARKKRWFTGENPAGLAPLPEISREEAHTISLPQLKTLLEAMRYPEKELALFALLTGMNLAEICGLQWKYVNLTESWAMVEGEAVAPRTIAVRKQCYRGRMSAVKGKTRERDLRMPEPLLSILLRLSRRAGFTGPDDFVFASGTGKPLNENKIATRRLQPLGKQLHMPRLSWHVFRRTHRLGALELGLHFQAHPAPLDPSGTLPASPGGRDPGLCTSVA